MHTLCYTTASVGRTTGPLALDTVASPDVIRTGPAERRSLALSLLKHQYTYAPARSRHFLRRCGVDGRRRRLLGLFEQTYGLD